MFSAEKTFNLDSIKNRTNIGAYAGFKLDKGEQLSIRIGTSFTSIKSARENLDAEMPGFNFERVAATNKEIWQKALAQIKVTVNERDKYIFYTAYYHTLQQPRLFNAVNGNYPRFASAYQNEKLEKGNYYDVFSMWDIYRAEIPLYEILNSPFVSNLVQSLILN